MRRILLMGLLTVGTDIVSGQTASTSPGQAYPERPIRIVTAGVGGGLDVAARLIAPGLSSGLGQQVIIDNRASASGAIAGDVVAKAPPDGYTLLFYGAVLWIGPLLQDKTSYDVVRDFAPITLATRAPNILVVHPSLPVRSVKELIALAKARAGELNYASGATGSSSHLAAELFKAMANVNIVHIAYKSGAVAMTDLVGGQVQLTFAVAGSVTPHVKSGRLRALAITSAQPSALAPGLPTVAATGLPGYESGSILGVFAPARTPAAIINRLNQEFVRVINQADVKEKLLKTGVEAVGTAPEDLTATVKYEITRLGKVIKDAGIREE